MTVEKKVEAPATEDPKPEDATETPQENTTFTQADLDRVAAKVRKEAEEAATKKVMAKLEADKAAADKASEEKALAEQSKFQELAEKREADVKALTTQHEATRSELDETKAALGRAESALATYLENLEKELTIPNGVKELLEGKPVAERLEWLTKNASTFKVATDDGTKTNEGRSTGKGIPPTPDAKKQSTPASKDEKASKAVSPRSYM